MRDTSAEADAVALEAMRRRPRVERLRDVLALSETVREIALVGLRRRFPAESTLALVERLTGTSGTSRSGPSAAP